MKRLLKSIGMYKRLSNTLLVCFTCSALSVGHLIAEQKETLFIERYGYSLGKSFSEDSAVNLILSEDPSQGGFQKAFRFIENTFAESLCTYYASACLLKLQWIEFYTIQQAGRELLAQFNTIKEAKTRQQLYFELYRVLCFYIEIPTLHNKQWLEKNFRLLRLMQKVCECTQSRALSSFPNYPSRPRSHFVFEGVSDEWLKQQVIWKQEDRTPYPYAAFKRNGEWDREQLAWTIAVLFDVDQAFTPTGVIDIYDQKCSVQPYWNYRPLSWPKNQIDVNGTNKLNDSIILNFSFEAYLDAYLGSLVLSLYDQSALNCRYRQLETGQYVLVNFDNGSFLPCNNGIFPEYLDGQLHILSRSLWAWYFDFPQADWTITGFYLDQLKLQTHDWDRKLIDLYRILSHPLTNFFQDAQDYWLNALELRVHTIRNRILNTSALTARDLLYSIIPQYKILIENVEHYIPSSKGAPMTTLGCVNFSLPMLRKWMIRDLNHPADKVDSFIDWMKCTYQAPVEYTEVTSKSLQYNIIINLP